MPTAEHPCCSGITANPKGSWADCESIDVEQCDSNHGVATSESNVSESDTDACGTGEELILRLSGVPFISIIYTNLLHVVSRHSAGCQVP